MAHSGYPVLYYSEKQSSDHFHMITGWHSIKAYKDWADSDMEKEAKEVFEPYVIWTSYSCVEMLFDAIPKASPGALTISYTPSSQLNRSRSDSESSNKPDSEVEGSEEEEIEEEEEEEEYESDAPPSSGASNVDSDSGVGSGSGRGRKNIPMIAWMRLAKLLGTEGSEQTGRRCRFVLCKGTAPLDFICKQHKTSNPFILHRIALPRA